MAENTTNNLVNYAKIDSFMIEKVCEIRNWENIFIAFEGNEIWLKGLREDQINSPKLKTIPNIRLYYSQNGKLFPMGSRLPTCNEPSFLWTPIFRGIKVQVPKFNSNQFDVNRCVSVQIVKSNEEKEAVGMMTTIKALEAFVLSSSAIRLQFLQWAVLNQTHAFLLGKPILPIIGDTYWRSNDFLFPTGYCFDLEFLSKDLDAMLNVNQLNFIVWNLESKYFLIDKLQLVPLTISSVRKTLLQK